MDVKVGVGALLFILYWGLLPHLMDLILETPKLKKAHWFIVGAINTCIVFSVNAACNNAFLSYLVMTVLIFVSFSVFYRNKFLEYLFCTLACTIHIIAIFIITVGSFAAISGFSPYEIIANQSQFRLCVIISFAIMDLVIIGIVKLGPLVQVRLKSIENGDIKASVRVKSVDVEKKNQLEMQRLSQCDALTGLDNKSISSKLIDEHLACSKTSPITNLSQKSFRQNRIEYVFKMLYQSDNPVAAIHSALELVASHFSFERGYIFETSKDGKTSSNTFEWCAEGITPQINNLQKLPIEAVMTANFNFQKNGIFILKSLDDVPPIEREVLEPQGIKSMFQFGIFDRNHLLGFIGFDNCRSETVPSDTEIDEMATICNILAVFFVKQHIHETAEKNLLARQEVMNHLDSYIYVIHPETFEVLFMNDKIQKLMKESQSETTCYRFFRGESEQCVDCPIRRLIDDETGREVCELYNEKLHIWMEVTASTLRWTDGNLACLMNCVDITEQKEVRQRHIHQLENLAYVDELTGGRTYYKFKEDAQRILEKQQDKLHFLVKLDIENFKLINQIYGYEKGNEVLCYLAKAIEKTTRNENEIFARITNDEFIALFTIEDKKDIDELYENFLHHFDTLVGSDFAFKCNFPHGRYIICSNNTKKLDVNDMFEKANIAHKAAKLDKTLDFVFYDERMTREALHVKEIENKMADALENNEFTVYLQPKYYLDDESIGGAEALTRWKTVTGDLLLPSTFIPIFEQNGFIAKLDFYIFEKACNIIKSWIEAGIEPVVVSVNFSRRHLNDINFVKTLCEIVDSIGIPRRYLEIEITETVIYDNIDTLEVLLNDIHKNGFSMSMDDFGSGYSSLGMLKNLAVDVIKLDRSFFANQRNAVRSKTVVGSVIQMAAGLGIRTVAEGVEDQAHIDFLRELHCDMVQGYYFAKPMEVERFTKLISK